MGQSSRGQPAVVITGASTGIGAASAMELARQAEQLQELAAYYKTSLDVSNVPKYRKEKDRVTKPVANHGQSAPKASSHLKKVFIQMPQIIYQEQRKYPVTMITTATIPRMRKTFFSCWIKRSHSSI